MARYEVRPRSAFAEVAEALVVPTDCVLALYRTEEGKDDVIHVFFTTPEDGHNVLHGVLRRDRSGILSVWKLPVISFTIDEIRKGIEARMEQIVREEEES